MVEVDRPVEVAHDEPDVVHGLEFHDRSCVPVRRRAVGEARTLSWSPCGSTSTSKPCGTTSSSGICAVTAFATGYLPDAISRMIRGQSVMR